MFGSMLALVLIVATLAAGLMAGVYFAFSAFIMRAFDRLGAAAAADAMNAVNDIILRSGFMILFFGSTLLYAGLALLALFGADIVGRGWLLAAASIYVIGMFACTAAFNVPLNNRLAAAAGDDADKAVTWPLYFRRWSRWNHLRAVCSLAACAIGIGWLVAHG